MVSNGTIIEQTPHVSQPRQQCRKQSPKIGGNVDSFLPSVDIYLDDVTIKAGVT
jgi:hypothetical protein